MSENLSLFDFISLKVIFFKYLIGEIHFSLRCFQVFALLLEACVGLEQSSMHVKRMFQGLSPPFCTHQSLQRWGGSSSWTEKVKSSLIPKVSANTKMLLDSGTSSVTLRGFKHLQNQATGCGADCQIIKEKVARGGMLQRASWVTWHQERTGDITSSTAHDQWLIMYDQCYKQKPTETTGKWHFSRHRVVQKVNYGPSIDARTHATTIYQCCWCLYLGRKTCLTYCGKFVICLLKPHLLHLYIGAM